MANDERDYVCGQIPVKGNNSYILNRVGIYQSTLHVCAKARNHKVKRLGGSLVRNASVQASFLREPPFYQTHNSPSWTLDCIDILVAELFSDKNLHSH